MSCCFRFNFATAEVVHVLCNQTLFDPRFIAHWIISPHFLTSASVFRLKNGIACNLLHFVFTNVLVFSRNRVLNSIQALAGRPTNWVFGFIWMFKLKQMPKITPELQQSHKSFSQQRANIYVRTKKRAERNCCLNPLPFSMEWHFVLQSRNNIPTIASHRDIRLVGPTQLFIQFGSPFLSNTWFYC